MKVRGDLEQRPEHKAAVFHIVVRNGQALAVNDSIAKQHDIEVQRARPPAFGFAHSPLLQFDALSMIEQRLGGQGGFQRNGGVEIVRLILRAQRRRAVERRDGDHAAVRNFAQGADSRLRLLQWRSKVAAKSDIDQSHALPWRGARLRGRR